MSTIIFILLPLLIQWWVNRCQKKELNEHIQHLNQYINQLKRRNANLVTLVHQQGLAIQKHFEYTKKLEEKNGHAHDLRHLTQHLN